MSGIVDEYVRKHPKSAALYERARGLFPGGVTHDTRYVTPFPVSLTHAQGALKWDVDGNEYVDYVMGHGALMLGHAHPAVVEAVAQQVAQGTHLGGPMELELRWAEAVKALIPSAERIRFVSSGTEATLLALRLVRAFTGRSKVVKFQEHFHGWHDYVLPAVGSLAGVPEATQSTVLVLPPNDIAAVERVLQEDGDVAAVILEPTGGHMGLLPLQSGFLQALREVTQRYGVLLVFDEVVTGFRTSKGGAQARFGVHPDLTALAKILGGGLPGGAVAGKAEVLEMIAHRGDPEWDSQRRVGHPGTFNANPLSGVAGSRVLELLATQPLNAHAEAMARRLKQGFNGVLAKLEVPGHAYGVGAIVHLSLGSDCDCDRELCTLAHQDLSKGWVPAIGGGLKRSLLNASVDCMGGRNYIVSAVHREGDIDRTVDAFEEALTAMRRDGVL
ncbi:MAG: aspartate aminotransferase family protein [Dehalococcoidia bacterium]